jgi:hypothetical protein
LASVYPGRITATQPASVELHVMMDLLNGHIKYLEIATDKESERPYQPFTNELKDTLMPEDAGYFDISYCYQIAKAGGHHTTLIGNAINTGILDSFDEQDHQVKGLNSKRVTSLKIHKHQIMDLTVTWAKRPGTYRLIASWDKHKSCLRYLITDLKRSKCSARQMINLYSLRWQIELLLNECKSYNHLKTRETAQAH